METEELTKLVDGIYKVRNILFKYVFNLVNTKKKKLPELVDYSTSLKNINLIFTFLKETNIFLL